MQRIWEFTGETKINLFGVTVKRIALAVKCKWGEVGNKGGWLEKEENLSGNAWVSGDAQVYGNARVSGNAQVYGNARVSGNAWVYGNARVSGDARVYGDARVENPLPNITGMRWPITFWPDGTIVIGCQKWSASEWAEKSDEQIADMEDEALAWWKRYGAAILAFEKAANANDEGERS